MKKHAKEIKIFLLFFVLNALLFLPRFILDQPSSDFFPIKDFTAPKESLYDFLKVFFIRDNYDIFRISADFFALTFLYLYVRRWVHAKWYTIFLYSYFIIILIYQLYHSVFEHIYKTEPLFYNDWKSIQIGFSIVNQGLTFTAVLIVLGLLLVFALLFIMVKKVIYLLAEIKVGRALKMLLLSFSLIFIFNLKYKLVQYSANTVQIQGLFVARNIVGSLKTAEQLEKFNLKKLMASNSYIAFNFKKAPNIYFIAIESYGSVVYKNNELKAKYIHHVDSCAKALQSEGWISASNFSVSPVHGGLSWISYSTIAYGYNFTNQGTYMTLLDDESLDRYDHLFNMLHKKGYRNYRLAPVPEVGKMTIPWDKYSRFYKADEWIRYKDLQYTGKLYGFGPSPSDQYSLNFAYDKIKKRGDGPFSLFFITENSHSPFFAPAHTVQNWKDLNDGTQEKIDDVNFIGLPTLTDYSKAIHYEFDVLTQFILQYGGEDDIFILVGDHQPPFIAKESDGRETPLHIISKNVAFQKSFLSYGFEEGLILSAAAKTMKHEGFYSMFARELIRHYGENYLTLPTYYPNGITF